ncbi:type VII secretion integral membrane protein EccD [Mycolicibacterium pulveris]|uniref:type VII secretion integral membrane protein EccD n=1 Tax=Mycolicibacterium pulveris TaxID=36813 RepID=UPI003CECAD7F
MTVAHDRGDTFHEVDLALPRGIDLCALMPSIVELARGTTAPATGIGWQLLHVDGQPLDESMTLDENEVADGTTLLLTATMPPKPVWLPRDVSQMAAQLTDADERPTRLPVAGCLVAAAATAAALGWSSTPADLVTATALSIGAAVGAVVMDRASTGGPMGAALSVAAVMLAAAAGFAAVPADPGAAHALLSAAAALAVATALLRLTRGATTWLTALATAAMLIAAIAGVAVGWQLPAATVGALLTAVSLAALSLAPRVSMLLAGIGPAPPDDPPPDTNRVSQAHRILTGVVVGATSAAVLGCGVVAVEALIDHAAKVSAAAFVAVTAAVLLFRTRTHADPARRIALSIGGIVTASVCFAMAVGAMPDHVHWLSMLAAFAGAAGLSRLIGLTVSPVTQRLVDVTEYLAVAAVVPLACWVADVYGTVRTTGLL